MFGTFVVPLVMILLVGQETQGTEEAVAQLGLRVLLRRRLREVFSAFLHVSAYIKATLSPGNKVYTLTVCKLNSQCCQVLA